jgi:hypothetical protein
MVLSMKNKILTICVLLCCSALLSFISTETKKIPASQFAVACDKFMWNNFHLGNYDSISLIISKLNDAYKRTPRDKKTTAYLGYINLWAFSERARKSPDPTFSGYVYRSNSFFKEAIKLNPDDARLKGFQSATEICEGALKKNMITLSAGYIDGILAINKWPQFNKFAFSLIGSQRSKNSPSYKLAMKYQWELIDDCSCKSLDKKTILNDPEKIFSDLINELQTNPDEKTKRVCMNSWIAPHNFEGFFLNFGDMLVKDGRLEEAKVIYSVAKLSPSYNDWPFQNILEERILNMKKNEIDFNQPLELVISGRGNQIFINSAVSCVACHQMSQKEFAKMGENN